MARLSARSPSGVNQWFPSLEQLYEHERRRARLEFPEVMGIHECSPHAYGMPRTALHSRFGYDALTHKHWKSDDRDYLDYAQTTGNVGGHVSVFSNGVDDRPAVFILRPAMRQAIHVRGGMMLASLFHELGHVDDILRGVNLHFDGEVDLSAAEEHAHRFACERILAFPEQFSELRRRFAAEVPDALEDEWNIAAIEVPRLLMALYICDALPKFAQMPFASIRSAAERVLSSDRMPVYREFAGSAVDVYE